MEFRDDQPIYLQIAEHFCENILLEKWAPGDRVPSVREMAVSIEVNPNTVMRTYTFLQDKGIIFNKRGIGYFVADEGFIKTRALRKDDFVENELPRFFKAMRLLDMTMDDVARYYQQFENNKDNDENK
ncbi:MAG: GntR family transcriptional regulator [Cyclobacteriaceae bacterium]|nr:GntR family transcriptional regulator [Cyclobacteriaceae bacterium]